MRLGILIRIAVVVFLLQAGEAAGEDLHFHLAPRDLVETRLRAYADNNRKREQALKEMFKEAGCSDQQVTEQPAKGSSLPNVICTLPGSTEKSIIVGAHFDHVSEGHGVVDNWSGASLLPSLYEAVKGEPRKHTYIFVGFTDEERGMVGSRSYARNMTREQIAATDAMVNIDTLGLAPTEYWDSRSDKVLANLLVYIAGKLSAPLKGVDFEAIGSTDSEQFAARKIPSITVHSLTQETFNARILHSYKDELSAIRFDDYYQTYHLMAAYISFLDQVQRPSSPSDKKRR